MSESFEPGDELDCRPEASTTGRYRRGQNILCKVGDSKYEDGYSCVVIETGDFGVLKTAAELASGDEVLATFYTYSPKERYNQHWKFPILVYYAPSEKLNEESDECS